MKLCMRCGRAQSSVNSWRESAPRFHMWFTKNGSHEFVSAGSASSARNYEPHAPVSHCARVTQVYEAIW